MRRDSGVTTLFLCDAGRAPPGCFVGTGYLCCTSVDVRKRGAARCDIKSREDVLLLMYVMDSMIRSDR